MEASELHPQAAAVNYDDMIHGFVSMTDSIDRATEAIADVAVDLPGRGDCGARSTVFVAGSRTAGYASLRRGRL